MKKLLITFIALSIASAMGLTAYGGFRHSGENSDNKQTCINYSSYNSLGDNSGKCGNRGENCTSACEPSTDGSGRFGSGEGKQAMCCGEFCK